MLSNFRVACSIELSETFILTGGSYTWTTVSKYSTSGWVEDLPKLNQGRQYHGCGYYFNEDMERVGLDKTFKFQLINWKRLLINPIGADMAMCLHFFRWLFLYEKRGLEVTNFMTYPDL